MIEVNAGLYEAAQAELRAGRWRIDSDRGVLKPNSDVVAGSLNTSGYLRLRFQRDGKEVGALAHRVMWEALRGPIPTGYYVNHIDGDKTNNAIANLELVTHQANMLHAHRSGLMQQQRFSRRALTPEVVVEVYRAAWSGLPARVVAERFDTTMSIVYRIKRREYYREVTEAVAISAA